MGTDASEVEPTLSSAETVKPLAEGRYRLVEVLGTGGMATVYRGYDERLQVYRAVKILAPELARRRKVRARFEAEARTMALLDHPHIVRVFDVGVDGLRAYIVMELVRGGSLVDRIQGHGPLPPRMALAACADVLRALYAAHEQGVVHRDIKPHNVLLTKTGQLKVTDFGIARMTSDEADDLTKTGAVMGTWGYMAPEQRINAKGVDGRADIYSMGATLYALVKGVTPSDLFAADMDPEMLSGIPEVVSEVVRGATRYRREDRYADVGTMLAAVTSAWEQLPPDPGDAHPLVPGAILDTQPSLLGVGTTEQNIAGTAVPATTGDSTPVASPRGDRGLTFDPGSLDKDPDDSVAFPPGPSHPATDASTSGTRETSNKGALVWLLGVGGLALVVGLAGAGWGVALYLQQGDKGDAVAVEASADRASTGSRSARGTSGDGDPRAAGSQGEDATTATPTAADPATGDLAAGDPAAGDLTGPDPAGPDPAAGDPGGAAFDASADAGASPGNTKVPATHGIAVTRPPISGDAASKTSANGAPGGAGSTAPGSEPTAEALDAAAATTTSAAAVEARISHSPVRSADAGGQVAVQAHLRDAPGYTLIKLFYRQGAEAWQSKAMYGTGGSYSTTLEVPAGATQVQYFIEAATPEPGQPKLRSGSGWKPHTIKIQ